VIIVRGTGWTIWTLGGCSIEISFTDASGTETPLASLPGSSIFKTKVTIPIDATPGTGRVRASQETFSQWLGRCVGPREAWRTFTVTELGRWEG
jgi:hypothetical protein